MIIWINGAFGAGKTQTAFELHRRIPYSFIYDPEEVGFFIRKNLPKELNGGDFQDYPMWRECNYSMLKYIADVYKGTILVPMTLVNKQYFNDIIEKLREDGIEIKHFVLGASKETLLKRLKSRGDGKNSWPAQQIERCITAFSDNTFEKYIDTEKLTIQAAAKMIAELSNIKLLPDNSTALKRAYDRLLVKLKKMRLFK